MSNAESFFARWSRRKAEEPRVGAPTETPAGPPELAEAAVPAPQHPAVAETPPSLDDVAALAPGDEVSRYVARGVDEAVKRAAVKKLFADPHFNIMDGLDIYIDDYSKPDPIPAAMLRQMNQSRSLGLFADEEPPTPAAATPALAPAADTLPAQDADPAAPAAEAVPQNDDEDPDLQLQPDDAARRPGADEGAGSDGL